MQGAVVLPPSTWMTGGSAAQPAATTIATATAHARTATWLEASVSLGPNDLSRAPPNRIRSIVPLFEAAARRPEGRHPVNMLC